jgi:homoisocitrate dehydrogenase
MEGKQVNMVIVRENTECLVSADLEIFTIHDTNDHHFLQYVKQEKMETLADGTKKAIAIRQITERASSRIGRMAFELALKRAEERSANPGGSFWKVRDRSHVVPSWST